MGHDLFKLLPPAGHRVIFEINARRDDQTIIREARAVIQHNLLLVTINQLRHLARMFDFILSDQRIIAMRDRFHIAEAA